MRYIRALGVRFIDGSFEEIMGELIDGGLMVVPAAPSLATLEKNTSYKNALMSSDIAIFDSGYLCLLLLFLKGVNVKKISGLEFLRKFIEHLKVHENVNVLLVDPSEEESRTNRSFLLSILKTITIDQYVAPMYQPSNIIDEDLLRRVKENRPKYIIINLGGGVQEILGAYLKEQISPLYVPTIICTGAAIAFLTGRQARIPRFMDYLYLGWLSRCISDPKRFVPRYLSGFKLFNLVVRSKVEKN